MAAQRFPEKLLDALEGTPGFNRKEFVEAHESGKQVVSIRINPFKNSNNLPSVLANAAPVPWTGFGYYLPERPLFIFDPLLHAGAYYVQEASSMFLEQAVRTTINLNAPLRVLDLCAAPGGKSTHLQSLISKGSLLVSNEVIKTRVGMLIENMTKWSAINVIVTSNDPGDFSALVNYFDLIVVDAPCSGSGLFRRAPDAINEWSENAVEICHLRQKRILSAAMPSLKEGGILVYSTCSYSPLEDESIAEWLCAEFSLETIRIPLKESWNIVETASVPHQAYGYRFFPDKLGGEGLYVCCFRKTGSVNQELKLSKKGRLSSASASDASIVRPWISDQAKDLGFYFHDEDLFAFPAMLEQDLNAIKQHLYIRHAGINIGRIMKMELIPDHAFALSGLVNKKIPSITLKKDEALQYLRKEEVKIDEGAGWALINYEGRNLGWIKRLKNRANNYYPKEWRILKSAITN